MTPALGVTAQNAAHRDIIDEMVKAGKRLERELRKTIGTPAEKNTEAVMGLIHDACIPFGGLLKFTDDQVGCRLSAVDEDNHLHVSWEEPAQGGLLIALMLKELNNTENHQHCPFTYEIHLSIENARRKAHGRIWVEIDPIAAMMMIRSSKMRIPEAIKGLKEAINGDKVIKGKALEALNDGYRIFAREDVEGRLSSHMEYERRYRLVGKRLEPTHTTNPNSIKCRIDMNQTHGELGKRLVCDVIVKDRFQLLRNDITMNCEGMPQTIMNALLHHGKGRLLKDLIAWEPFQATTIQTVSDATEGDRRFKPELTLHLDRTRIEHMLIFEVISN